ncbi:MAG: hypothetical protein LBS16_06475, partial [Prevotellaceae bacterium]|nr:hypothetical protein [Prevotellaceae bacterium]
MKTNQFIFAALAAAFLSGANYAAAQVTIGGSDAPKAGTILDLNSTTKGGLLLSNVELKAVNAIPASFPNASAITDDAHKQALAGAMVWNTNDEFPLNGDGLYSWDGSKWIYIGGSDGVCIPTGVGTFTGKFCFDIATGNDGINGCGTTAVRSSQKTVFTNRTSQDGVSAAPYSGVQVYTFTPSGTVSNVRFEFIEAVGAGKIVESIVPSDNYSGTVSSAQVMVNYKSSLQNDLSGLTRDTGLKLKLYAIYNDGNIDRAIELN